MQEKTPHIPVLLQPVLTYLSCQNGGSFVDGTFGAGGYTRAILTAHPNNRVFAFDRDPTVLPTAQRFQREFGDRFVFIPDCFGTMETHLTQQVDGIVLDLGVSSMQIDQPDRGFSFRFDGPLDMRMSCNGQTAKDVVNTFSEKQLADILFLYGEERASRRIARAICQYRVQKSIETTTQLADIIHRVMPKPKDGSDSAMRSFQALRIYVNDELGELERVLDSSKRLLLSDGRLVVVTFHSLEDRIVKNFMIQNSALRPNENRYCISNHSDVKKDVFQVMTRKPVVADETELTVNPRSHSAKLRCAVRLEGE